MKKIIVKTTCVMSLFSTMTCAIAVASLPAGFYVEGNMGQSKSMGKAYPSVSLIKNTGKAGSINAGYKFLPYFGLEAGFTRYAATRLNSPVQTVARDSHTSIDVAGKVILPIECSGLELFAKAGIARIYSQIGVIDSAGAAAYDMTFNTSAQTSTGLFIGGGAQYYFTPNVAVNVQWERAKGNSKTGNLQLLSAGISYMLDPAFM